MRKWAGGLHGGQLVIVLAALSAVGYGSLRVGTDFYLVPANSLRRLADSVHIGAPWRGLAPDTAQALRLYANADSQSNVGFAFDAFGLAAWLGASLVLWWWLGARRRPSGNDAAA